MKATLPSTLPGIYMLLLSGEPRASSPRRSTRHDPDVGPDRPIVQASSNFRLRTETTGRTACQAAAPIVPSCALDGTRSGRRARALPGDHVAHVLGTVSTHRDSR